MSKIIKFPVLKSRRLSSLLGISLDGSRLDGVVLQRTNGSLQIQQSFSVSLSLDPLTADVELVGREIRNHLDAAGVRERRCVVSLPLKWALTTHAEVPQMDESDVASFLQIEAERGFPCDAATLQVSTSTSLSASGKRHAILVGVPRNHVILLEQALRAAKLKPLSFSLGIAALQPAVREPLNGVLALAIGEAHVGMQVTCGGGVAALRGLEGTLELSGSRRVLHADVVAREARITLGQLPAEFREAVRRIRVFGPRDLGQQLADQMELRFEPAGLKVELVSRYSSDEFGLEIPPDAPVSPAVSLAAGKLAGRKSSFEFLPPRVTAWQQIANRYSSGKLRTVGAAAAAVLLIAGGMFLFQQWQLMRWDSQWKTMATKVRELEAVQQQIRQFRPWFDDSLRGLTILRQLTSAFPEDGVVAAKTVEIRDLNTVMCTGTARDNQALLKTLERLRAAGGVSDLKVNQIRGKSPMQFTFDFHWSEGGKVEN
ncbi:MAG: hypothetical protein QOJ40_3082 [Verrucomicrobiota bacterium]